MAAIEACVSGNLGHPCPPERTEGGTLCDQEPFLFLVKKQESPLKLMRCSFKLRCGVALGKGLEWLAASHKRHRTGVASVAVRAVEVIQLAAGTFVPLHPCSIVFSWWLLTFVGPCVYADVYSRPHPSCMYDALVEDLPGLLLRRRTGSNMVVACETLMQMRN